MTIWIDAQISPFIASWINSGFTGLTAKSLRSLGLRDASDHEIFKKAKQEEVILISKDQDFLRLMDEYGPPPRLIWITCGNTSNARMCEILASSLKKAIDFLKTEAVVEING